MQTIKKYDPVLISLTTFTIATTCLYALWLIIIGAHQIPHALITYSAMSLFIFFLFMPAMDDQKSFLIKKDMLLYWIGAVSSVLSLILSMFMILILLIIIYKQQPDGLIHPLTNTYVGDIGQTINCLIVLQLIFWVSLFFGRTVMKAPNDKFLIIDGRLYPPGKVYIINPFCYYKVYSFCRNGNLYVYLKLPFPGLSANSEFVLPLSFCAQGKKLDPFPVDDLIQFFERIKSEASQAIFDRVCSSDKKATDFPSSFEPITVFEKGLQIFWNGNYKMSFWFDSKD